MCRGGHFCKRGQVRLGVFTALRAMQVEDSRAPPALSQGFGGECVAM